MSDRSPRQRPRRGVLGKHLTRRSRGRCELCESREGPRVFELAPFPPEPRLDRALMACDRCRRWLQTGEVEPLDAWFLSSAVWSEEPAIRLAAARLLLEVDDPTTPWVRDALDAVDVDPESGEFRGGPGQ